MRASLCVITIAAATVVLAPIAGGQEPNPEDLALVTKQAAERYHKSFLAWFPEIDTISKMTAEVHADPTDPEAKIDRFEIPEQFYGEILAEFRRGKIDRDPNLALWEDGSILITDEAKGMRRLSWYMGAQGAPLMFSFDGVRLKTDGRTADGKKVLGGTRVVEILEKARSASRKGDAKK